MRQAGEPAESFDTFCTFKDLGRTRTLVKAAEETGVRHSVLTIRSGKWRWYDRANAWDDHLLREANAAEVKAVREMRERHIRLAQHLQFVGGGTIAKLAEAIQRNELVEITPAEARALVEAGAKLERLNRGEPETIVEQRGELRLTWKDLAERALKDDA